MIRKQYGKVKRFIWLKTVHSECGEHEPHTPWSPGSSENTSLPHLHHWYQQHLLDRQNEWRLSHLLVAVQMLSENPWSLSSLSSHPNLWISSRLTPCHIYHPTSKMICDWNLCFDEVVHFQFAWEPLQRGRGRTHLPKITCRAACRQIHFLWQTAQVGDILVDTHSRTSCVYVPQKLIEDWKSQERSSDQFGFAVVPHVIDLWKSRKVLPALHPSSLSQIHKSAFYSNTLWFSENAATLCM